MVTEKNTVLRFLELLLCLSQKFVNIFIIFMVSKVRFADEIVDTFHDYDKAKLLDEFEKTTEMLWKMVFLSQSYSSFFLYHKEKKYSSAFGRCVFAFYENGFGRYQGFE